MWSNERVEGIGEQLSLRFFFCARAICVRCAVWLWHVRKREVLWGGFVGVQIKVFSWEIKVCVRAGEIVVSRN